MSNRTVCPCTVFSSQNLIPDHGIEWLKDININASLHWFGGRAPEKVPELSKPRLHPAPSAFQQMVTSGNGMDMHGLLAFTLGQKLQSLAWLEESLNFFSLEFARKTWFEEGLFPSYRSSKGHKAPLHLHCFFLIQSFLFNVVQGFDLFTLKNHQADNKNSKQSNALPPQGEIKKMKEHVKTC